MNRRMSLKQQLQDAERVPRIMNEKIFIKFRDGLKMGPLNQKHVTLVMSIYDLNFAYRNYNKDKKPGKADYGIFFCAKFLVDHSIQPLGGIRVYNDSDYSEILGMCIQAFVIDLWNLGFVVLATVSPPYKIFKDAIRFLVPEKDFDKEPGAICYNVDPIRYIHHLYDLQYCIQKLQYLYKSRDITFSAMDSKHTMNNYVAKWKDLEVVVHEVPRLRSLSAFFTKVPIILPRKVNVFIEAVLQDYQTFERAGRLSQDAHGGFILLDAVNSLIHLMTQPYLFQRTNLEDWKRLEHVLRTMEFSEVIVQPPEIVEPTAAQDPILTAAVLNPTREPNPAREPTLTAEPSPSEEPNLAVRSNTGGNLNGAGGSSESVPDLISVNSPRPSTSKTPSNSSSVTSSPSKYPKLIELLNSPTLDSLSPGSPNMPSLGESPSKKYTASTECSGVHSPSSPVTNISGPRADLPGQSQHISRSPKVTCKMESTVDQSKPLKRDSKSATDIQKDFTMDKMLTARKLSSPKSSSKQPNPITMPLKAASDPEPSEDSPPITFTAGSTSAVESPKSPLSQHTEAAGSPKRLCDIEIPAVCILSPTSGCSNRANVDADITNTGGMVKTSTSATETKPNDSPKVVKKFKTTTDSPRSSGEYVTLAFDAPTSVCSNLANVDADITNTGGMVKTSTSATKTKPDGSPKTVKKFKTTTDSPRSSGEYVTLAVDAQKSTIKRVTDTVLSIKSAGGSSKSAKESDPPKVSRDSKPVNPPKSSKESKQVDPTKSAVGPKRPISLRKFGTSDSKPAAKLADVHKSSAGKSKEATKPIKHADVKVEKLENVPESLKMEVKRETDEKGIYKMETSSGSISSAKGESSKQCAEEPMEHDGEAIDDKSAGSEAVGGEAVGGEAAGGGAAGGEAAGGEAAGGEAAGGAAAGGEAAEDETEDDDEEEEDIIIARVDQIHVINSILYQYHTSTRRPLPGRYNAQMKNYIEGDTDRRNITIGSEIICTMHGLRSILSNLADREISAIIVTAIYTECVDWMVEKIQFGYGRFEHLYFQEVKYFCPYLAEAMELVKYYNRLRLVHK